MEYAFIEQQRSWHCVRRMCKLHDVSPAGYYEWRGRTQSVWALANHTVRERIAHAHVESRGTYGRPRIYAELRAQGITIGINRIGRLMKAPGIKGIAPRRFRKTTDSTHALPIAENILDRQFDIKEIAS